MTCVKTGCHIYLAHYGIYAYGDAHKVGEAYFFRLVQEDISPTGDVLNYELISNDSWWDRHKDVSTLVANASDVIDYGYDGRPISEFPHTHKGA